MTLATGHGFSKFARKIAVVLTALAAFVLVQAFSGTATAGTSVGQGAVRDCDSAVIAVNNSLVSLAKNRIAVRTARGSGVRTVRRAKRAFKLASARASVARKSLATYCGTVYGVAATSADCGNSIEKLTQTIDVYYTRKLAYRKINTRTARGKKRGRVMRTRLNHLASDVKTTRERFLKACGTGGGESTEDLGQGDDEGFELGAGTGNGGSGSGDSGNGGSGTGNGGSGGAGNGGTGTGNGGNGESGTGGPGSGNGGTGNGGPGNGGTGSGNGSGSGNSGATADTTPPGSVTISGPSGSTNTNPVTIMLGSDESDGHFKCRIDNGPFAAVSATWTLPDLDDGEHTVVCHYVDASGNVGPDGSITFTIDTAGPTTTITVTSDAGDATPTFTASSSESNSTTHCALDGNSIGSVTGNYSVIGLADGEHTISCYSIDAAGNVGATASIAVVVDSGVGSDGDSDEDPGDTDHGYDSEDPDGSGSGSSCIPKGKAHKRPHGDNGAHGHGHDHGTGHKPHTKKPKRCKPSKSKKAHDHSSHGHGDHGNH